MGRVIADRILATEFCGDFVERVIQLRIGSIDRIARNEPGLSAAGVCDGVEDGHVDRIQVASAARITRREIAVSRGQAWESECLPAR